MDAQILYATMTGHSRKIAKAIAKETGLPLFDLKEKPVLPPCGLLLVISGIYGRGEQAGAAALRRRSAAGAGGAGGTDHLFCHTGRFPRI